MIDLSIVIPAYNEAGRIGDTLQCVTSYLASQPYESELIVVDDGSTDSTDAIVRQFARSHRQVRILRTDRNNGKGAAVKRGILDARGKYVFFMDADLSVPVEELTDALAALSSGKHRILIGSRRLAGSRILEHQPRLREWMGRGFTWLARAVIWRPIVDFTCGFKGFHTHVAKTLFAIQTCRDWSFDVEVLYLARLLNESVHQHPVRWTHRNRSRVRLPRDAYRTLVALVRIRWRTARAVRKLQIEGCALEA